MTDRARTDLLDRLRAGFILLLVLAASFALAATASAKPPTDADCLACHSETIRKEKKPPKKALEASVHGEAGLSCVDCHADLAKVKELPHADKLKPVSCSSCHDGMAEKHPFHPMMAADAEAIACQDCHGGHDVKKPSDPSAPVSAANVSKVCAGCHETEVNLYGTSAHGVAAAANVKEAPACLTCHRTRVTSAADGAPAATEKQAQEKLCLHCHLDSPDVRARVAPSAGFIARYEQSVHGQALLREDVLDLLQLAVQRVVGGDDLLAVIVKDLSFAREAELLFAALDEQRLELAFKRADLLADGGLGHAIDLGSLGEALGFGEVAEYFKTFDLHKRIASQMR